MKSSQPFACSRTWMPRLLRLFTITLIWGAFVALGTMAFFAPRGVEAQPEDNDLLAFALALGVASATSAAAALTVAGRWRWAAQLASCVVAALLMIAAVAGYLLWIDIQWVRGRVDFSTFVRYQAMTRIWAEQAPGVVGPQAAAVGLALGLVAGLLSRLASRAPRLAPAVGVGLLFALASEPGRWLDSAILTRLSQILHYHFVPWTIADDQITIAGAVLGAAAGAVVAGMVLHFTARAQSHCPTVKSCCPPSTSGTETLRG